ncbi:MAG: EAL domain-containing protein [Rhodospirillales bacterium]|nr:EAL domain-containing protein [Rhodospirillales bacterium]MBO6785591.1 EAL domain-containing protein [Rhodospirillales bacterium]
MPENIYSRLYQAGDVIFRRGEPGEHAYFIERGAVDVIIEKEGDDVVIAKLGPGEIIGEMSMIDDAPRSADVIATAETELIVIQRSRVIKPLTSADPMMNLILRVVLTRFRNAQNRYSGLNVEGDKNNSSLEEIRAMAFQRIHDERDLLSALEAQEFRMHYQPIISLESGKIAGFEALMRWEKADGSFVSPGHFIPLAEHTGLIVELGRFALETSLGDQARFAEAFAKMNPGDTLPFMSTNVSGLQLSDLDEIDLIGGIIHKSGVPLDQVKLEITETLMVENPDHAAEALRKLKALGISLAIDDFGTGYSSLSYLHMFPLDTLKIDRAFVNSMDDTENSRRIVLSIVGLALALEMNIVAEGIETDAQQAKLQELGCHYGQGYYFAKPQSAKDALELINSGKTWQI